MSQDAQHKARIPNIREALKKVGDMLQQEWFFEEVAQALRSGDTYEAKLICKSAPQGYVVALGRSAKTKRGDNSFIRLEME